MLKRALHNVSRNNINVCFRESCYRFVTDLRFDYKICNYINYMSSEWNLSGMLKIVGSKTLPREHPPQRGRSVYS